MNETRKEQRLLMETAMRIMEVFCDMWYAQWLINPDKIDTYDFFERLQLFCDWAEEFEEKYRGTEEYEDDFIGLSDEFATKKLIETFGNKEDDDEQIRSL